MRQSTHTDLTESLKCSAHGATLARELLMETDETPNELTRPLLDAVGLFEKLGIGYALIGGLAAMVYGRTRFTVDVDFIAQNDHEKMLAANPDAMTQCHFDPTSTWKLYHDSGTDIDIWKDEHANAMISRAVTTKLAGRGVRIIEPHDLITMKLRADRPQDDYDISEILKHTSIDDAIVEQRVTAEQFDAYLAIKKRIT